MYPRCESKRFGTGLVRYALFKEKVSVLRFQAFRKYGGEKEAYRLLSEEVRRLKISAGSLQEKKHANARYRLPWVNILCPPAK